MTVTSPSTAPYSSITSATCLCELRNDSSSCTAGIESGTNSASRVSAAQLDARALERHRQQIRGAHDAEHVVEAALADDELRVRVRGQELAQLVVGGIDVDPLDVRPRRHDRGHALIAELEHALDDVLFGGADGAGLGALADQRLDLVFGEVRLGVALDAEHPQHEVGRRRSAARRPDRRSRASNIIGRATHDAIVSGC